MQAQAVWSTAERGQMNSALHVAFAGILSLPLLGSHRAGYLLHGDRCKHHNKVHSHPHPQHTRQSSMRQHSPRPQAMVRMSCEHRHRLGQVYALPSALRVITDTAEFPQDSVAGCFQECNASTDPVGVAEARSKAPLPARKPMSLGAASVQPAWQWPVGSLTVQPRASAWAMRLEDQAPVSSSS